jgi:hypothetical protein
VSACCGRTTPTGSPLPCGPTVIPLFRREPCHQGYLELGNNQSVPPSGVPHWLDGKLAVRALIFDQCAAMQQAHFC